MDAAAEEEFAAFVRARQHALVRFGYALTGDRMLGEDLAQTALAKLHLKWATIRQAGALEAWVRKVMVNEHTSWWRRAWRHRESVGIQASEQVVPVEDRLPDHDLWQAVLTLPARQRAAVVLRYYEDLTEAQTAEVLGCSIGSVKSQTHRELATLRSRYEEVPA
jgi:RNA polymerase sigma-70 factor (sigma-E family)